MSTPSQPDASRTRRSPQRLLLVDDDELELELMADRLQSLGFETHTAGDGGAALELLQTQSFPVVITDWQMPHVDGIQLTERLRSQGDEETYIIMLTVLDDGTSHERGFLAGVDDYLSKRAPDAKIVARVRAAFKAVEMRQALHAATQHNAGSVSDVANGVLADRLRAEVRRAARYSRHLAVLVLQLEAEGGASVRDMMTRATEVATAGIRTDIDFVTRYRSVDGVQRLAIVLPETDRTAAIAVGARLCGSLISALQTPLDSFTARVGCASFAPGEETRPPEQIAANIQALLREAEANVRLVPMPAGSARRGDAG
jgi:two-component system, cell cycle response regulator